MSTLPTELVAFDGVVECRRSAGPIALRLCAARREGDTELLFAGVMDPPNELPAQLRDARVLQMAPPSAMTAGPAAGSAAYRIEAREGHFELRSQSVQLHREVGAAFFRAVPPAPVPRAARLGWGLLLALLRLPGAARLLGR